MRLSNNGHRNTPEHKTLLTLTIMAEDKTTGYAQRQYNGKTKRYCQTMELKGNEELVAKYIEAHSYERHWREIREGIRAVGILEMEIYILGNRLFMIVETPDDFNWDEAMARLATLPRQQEWEQYVAHFQQCSADATSAEKWQMMERMFYLYPESN